MTNGYNQSNKSRSCETNLNLCGKTICDDLTVSSSSLIDLPTTLRVSHAHYDSGHSFNDENDDESITHQTSSRLFTQSSSTISSELDQKVKDEIDARLKDIDDEFDYKCKNLIYLEKQNDNHLLYF